MPTQFITGVAQVLLSAAATAAAAGLWSPDTQLIALILALQSAFGGTHAFTSQPKTGH